MNRHADGFPPAPLQSVRAVSDVTRSEAGPALRGWCSDATSRRESRSHVLRNLFGNAVIADLPNGRGKNQIDIAFDQDAKRILRTASGKRGDEFTVVGDWRSHFCL